MADDSGDSDIEPRPSCSKSRRNTRGNNNHGGGNCTESRKGRQRRIVMRIEFDDSGEDSSSASEVSGDDGRHGNNLNEQPSISTRTRRARKTIGAGNKESESDESDNIQWNKSQRLRNRRTNMLCINGSDSDESSSGSEINRSVKTRVTKPSKKIIISEDEQFHTHDDEAGEGNSKRKEAIEAGFNSDSSSNELLEKCPICLLTFRQQEIGSPATCAHIFCASCIEAWSKNVQTCPIDRIEFDRIIVRENHENRRIVREINVDPNKISKELTLDDEAEALYEDVTNCEICNSPEREDVMLLCDECNQGYHMDCLTPRLTQIPEGSWYCDNCFDASAESDDVSEDLNLLYEDIRDMGIPQAALRVTELQQPRILRTRQNERIRAAVLRTTRSRTRTETTTTTTTSTSTGRGRGRPRGSTTTTTTTTTRRQPNKRRRRRRARKRTYVVEYDLNNFDEKFAIKTTKKIIRRRRRKRGRSARNALRATTGGRMTASKRLAEQMGVKKDPTYTSHLSGTSAGLSLFGGANDLEYFSDSDNGGIEHEIQVETGHGTAVQTSIRISNFGSQRAHKGILLGRLRGNNRSSMLPDLQEQSGADAGGDLLSSIMDIQDRWHNAARHMENVRINADGTLQLPSGGDNANNNGVTKLSNADADSNTRQMPTTGNQTNSNEQASTPINPLEGVVQTPLYSRGGGNQSFNTGGGSSGGNYNNNRYNNNNQSNYRGSGGGQYRHSTGGNSGGDGGGNNNSMMDRGNFNFSNQNFSSNNSNPIQNPNFSPFSMRFNQRNNNQRNNNNNNQRNSLPFMHRGDDDRQQQQQQQQQNQSQNMSNESINLFGGLPPPIRTSQSVMGASPLMPSIRPMNMTGPPPMSGPPLMPAPAHMPVPPSIMGPLPMAGHPPPTMGMSGPPPPLAMHSQMQSIRPIMTVPPPPAPPPGVPMPWGTPIFQQLNNDYGNDDDDDTNCPNFSVYSAESQEVAKSTEMQPQTQQDNEAAKEDDENEDLVQLDDDDDIPMPPEINPNQPNKVKNSDLYEPENPTEENDDEAEELEEEKENEEAKSEDNDNEKIKINNDEKVENVENLASPLCKELESNNPNNDDTQYDVEEEIMSNDVSNLDANKNTIENINEIDKSDKENNDKEPIVNEQDACDEKSEHTQTPSPTVSEPKLPENDITIANKKGVLELYDDSDWEELDIEKPKEYEKAARAAGKSDIEESQCEEEGELADEKERSKNSMDDKGQEPDDRNESEPDRSYTPCLDENNEPEEVQENEQNNDAGPKSLNSSKDSSKEEDAEDGGKTPDVVVNEPTVIETEVISDDEDNARGVKKRRGSKKRDKRDKKVEIFKKVSKKQKIRNYRTEKLQSDKYKGKRRSINSRSRSISKSKSKSRSRSRTRSRSRLRSRTRSPRAAVSRSRSSRSARSRSRSPRGRGRRRSRSGSYRSRSRSNNKENNWRYGGRFINNHFNKFQDRHKNQNQYRSKRREIQRYNVRNVVGIQRNFREEREVRDRYGRDANRPMHKFSRSSSPRHRRISGRSFSRSRSRGRSVTPKRNRRGSFSISPSPQPLMRRQSISPRHRYHSPHRITPIRVHSRSPIRIRSRSLTPQRMAGRKVIRRVRGRSPLQQSAISRSPSPLHSISESPRYTPRLHRSNSKTPLLHVVKGKKKLKEKGKKKKKKKQRLTSLSPETNIRISRQRDAFEVDRPPKKKRRHTPKQQPSMAESNWSPSPSPPPVLDYDRDNNVSWTPPLLSPRLVHEMHGIYEPETRRSNSPSSKRDKRKRLKKKKKAEKRRDLRKDKRRIRRTQTPEPIPSKEVFASGNNILVSVSFNKDAATNQQPSQTTVVTLPATREDLHTIRRSSIDCLTGPNVANKKKKKRKKLEAKPIAIIDLERSPFQVHQEPTDVIVLTDSEEGVDGHDSEHDHEHESERRRESHRERRRSESLAEEMDHHRSQMSNGIRSSSQLEKTPPLERERLETILEESYDLPQTGPKTPPEPPTVKFTMVTKKQNKIRNNPLHDDNEMNSESEMAEVRELDTHRPELEAMHVQSNQKIGPNTPPESGPCSPDAYDPFDPTKSPSISPRSPSPAPMNSSQGSINVDGGVEVVSTQKHIIEEQRQPNERTNSQISGAGSNMTTQGPTLNPVELVMKLMNTKQNSSQDMNKSNEPQYNTASHMHSTGMMNAHDDGLGMRDKGDEPMSLTVISNVLLSNGNTQASQHIPVISSPTPMVKGSQISKLPLPKVGSSVGSSSAGMPSSNSNMRNGGLDEPVNLNEMESPYSPGSADYEDLFEPPPESSGLRRSKRTNNKNNAKLDVFDNLFGSTSPVGHTRMSKKFKAIITSSTKKSKIKVGKTDDHIKVYDDVPNSAVELQVKDKFLRKLNRQERVVEEVKLVLKPRFNKKQITKDDYKEIMRRAVPKICHSRSGEINPHKIKNLIDAYVRKFRAKHKKLNLLNTGQVSSAVKCAAYLKKL